jgi:hypothetical protein
VTQQEAHVKIEEYLNIGRKLNYDEGNQDAVYLVDDGIREMQQFTHGLALLSEEDQRLFFYELYGVVMGSDGGDAEMTEDEMIAEMVSNFLDFYPRFDGQGCANFDHLIKR